MKLKIILLICLIFALTTATILGIFMFIAWNVNFSEWDPVGRFFAAVFSLGIGFLITCSILDR